MLSSTACNWMWSWSKFWAISYRHAWWRHFWEVFSKGNVLSIAALKIIPKLWTWKQETFVSWSFCRLGIQKQLSWVVLSHLIKVSISWGDNHLKTLLRVCVVGDLHLSSLLWLSAVLERCISKFPPMRLCTGQSCNMAAGFSQSEPSKGKRKLAHDTEPPSFHGLILKVTFYHISCIIFSVLRHSVMSSSLATPWTVAHQAPLSVRFPRQEYWSGLPFPPPTDLPDPGIEPMSPMSFPEVNK